MCRPLTDFSVQLFNTAEECCRAKVSWRSANECIADTENIPAVGTDDWYIDWKLQKVCCFGPVLCWCAGLLHLAIYLTILSFLFSVCQKLLQEQRDFLWWYCTEVGRALHHFRLVLWHVEVGRFG